MKPDAFLAGPATASSECIKGQTGAKRMGGTGRGHGVKKVNRNYGTLNPNK